MRDENYTGFVHLPHAHAERWFMCPSADFRMSIIRFVAFPSLMLVAAAVHAQVAPDCSTPKSPMPVASRHMPLLMFLWVSSFVFASNAAADPVAVAQLKCDQRTNTLALKYVRENDDFISEPNFPLSCRLGRVAYKVTGMRDAPRESGMCGAQPPISISVLRNRIPVISEAIFGENCFQGPAVSSVTIGEGRDVLKKMVVCVLKEPGADPLCVLLLSKMGSENDSAPISQSDISDLAGK